MLLKIKKALSDAASEIGCFRTLDYAELENFAQSHNFKEPLIRLEPIERYEGSIDEGGVIRNNLTVKLWFLTIFKKDNDGEDLKDQLIDQMEELSNDYYSILNNSQSISQGSLSQWRTTIVRQETSNLLCGVICEARLDTTCARL